MAQLGTIWRKLARLGDKSQILILQIYLQLLKINDLINSNNH